MTKSFIDKMALQDACETPKKKEKSHSKHETVSRVADRAHQNTYQSETQQNSFQLRQIVTRLFLLHMYKVFDPINAASALLFIFYFLFFSIA